MDEQEKAFVIAAIKIKIENDKKKERELKSKIRLEGGAMYGSYSDSDIA